MHVEIFARNHRLGKYAKPSKTERELNRTIFVHVRPDANQHVRAYHAWLAIQTEYITPPAFIKACCLMAGITTEELFSQRRIRALIEVRHSMIRLVAARWPKLSSTKLGLLFHRDHTVILYALNRQTQARKHKASLTEAQVIVIRARLRSGLEMTKDIAKDFGVVPPTISAIATGRTWRGVE